VSTTLLTGITGISLCIQWPLTSQSHGEIVSEVSNLILRILFSS
jgi:hypothetical protein